MALRTWTGSVDGDLSKAGNWGGTAPSGSDTALIPNLLSQYPNIGSYGSATGIITVQPGASINGGTFPNTAAQITNNGTITNGTFYCGVDNSGTISGGIFNSAVVSETAGHISGGFFYGSVTYYPNTTITGGNFLGSLVLGPIEVGAAIVNCLVQSGDGPPVTLGGGTTALPSNLLCSRSDIENIFGIPNIIKWALLSANDPASSAGQAEITNRINWAISVSSTDFRNAMRQGGYVLPLNGADGVIWQTNITAIRAGLYLYMHLRPTQRGEDGRPTPDRYDGLFTYCEQQLDFVRSRKIKLDGTQFGSGVNGPLVTHEPNCNLPGPYVNRPYCSAPFVVP